MLMTNLLKSGSRYILEVLFIFSPLLTVTSWFFFETNERLLACLGFVLAVAFFSLTTYFGTLFFRGNTFLIKKNILMMLSWGVLTSVSLMALVSEYQLRVIQNFSVMDIIVIIGGLYGILLFFGFLLPILFSFAVLFYCRARFN